MADSSDQRPVVFVMPLFADRALSAHLLSRALTGVERQTDPRWNLVIVDDASFHGEAATVLERALRRDPDRVHVIRMPTHRGPGPARNVGVRWAAERQAKAILFNDADDVSDPKRVAVVRKRLLGGAAACDFMYSPVIVVDEDDVPIKHEVLPPSTAEILAAHHKPPTGENAWIDIATRTGYATVTSTVAVTTRLAVHTPFPDVAFSEDSHTWLRMTAGSNGVCFDRSVPTRYCISRGSVSHSHRDRVGSKCNREKLRVDTDGFLHALAIALVNDSVTPGQATELNRRFFDRMARTMLREGEVGLARQALNLAVRGQTGPEEDSWGCGSSITSY